MDNDFFDFMLFWELMGENEDDLECPLCGVTIGKGQQLEFVYKTKQIFKCPECGKKLRFDPDLKALTEVEEV